MNETRKVCAGGGIGVLLDGDVLRIRAAHAAYAATVPLPDGLRGSDVAAVGVMPLTVLTSDGSVWHHDGGTRWQRTGSVHDGPPPAAPKRGPRTFSIAGRDVDRGQARMTVVLLKDIVLGPEGVGLRGDTVEGQKRPLLEMCAAGSARPATAGELQQAEKMEAAR